MRYKAYTIGELQKLRNTLVNTGQLANRRSRYQSIAKYIAREGDHTEASNALKALVRNGRKSVLRNIEVPLIEPKMEADLAFQYSQFLTGYPIFTVVGTKKDKVSAAVQLTTLMERDQERFNWVAELLLTFADGLRYNLCGTETTWYQKWVPGQAGTGALGSATPQQVSEYEGNKIKRIDPFNLLFDDRLPPNKAVEHGQYVGYVEQFPAVEAKALLQEMNNDFKVLQNLSQAIQSQPSDLYYQCSILDGVYTKGDGWDNFFGTTGAGVWNGTDMHEFCTLYVKLVPKTFGIVTPRSGSPEVYKLVYLNTILVYVEPVGNYPHPMTICQPRDFGNGQQDKGFCENLTDLQDVASSLQQSRLKSLRRAVGDRALYDSSRVSKLDLQNATEESKIPVKPQKDKTLQDAYYRIPFEDNSSGSFGQELQLISNMADSASGINRAAEGNFIKGNKTLFEFENIVNAGQSRSQLRGINFKAFLIHPIKDIMKKNYITRAIRESVFNAESQAIVQVDPSVLAQEVVEFKVSDGMTPASKMLAFDTISMVLQNPVLVQLMATKYDLASMLVDTFQQLGLRNLNDYALQPAATADSGVPAGQPTDSAGG